MEKAASEKQVRANRRNALKSTGPRTVKGKERVRWNSLKHGLLAKEVVVSEGEGQEEAADFRRVLDQLTLDLAPNGTLEHMLVERIAVCYWRLRRVVRYETGQIRGRLDRASWNAAAKRAEQFSFDRQTSGLLGSGDLMKTTIGIDHLISVLDSVHASVIESGDLEDWARERLFEAFGVDKEGLAALCVFFSVMAEKNSTSIAEGADSAQGSPDPAARKQVILDLLKNHKSRLTQLREVIEENEELSCESSAMALSLPPPESVDKIVRYETAIERQLYRAVSMLERLQSRRAGPTFPACATSVCQHN